MRGDTEVLREMDDVAFFLIQGVLVEVREGKAIRGFGRGECCFGDVFYIEISVKVGAIKVKCSVFGIEFFCRVVILCGRLVDPCGFQYARYLGSIGIIVVICMGNTVYFHIDVIVVASRGADCVGTERESGGFCIACRCECEKRDGMSFSRFEL